MPFTAKYEGLLGDLDLKPTASVCDRCFMFRAVDGSCDCGAGWIRDESDPI